MLSTLHTISALFNIVIFSLIGFVEFMRYRSTGQKLRLLFIPLAIYWVVVYSYFFWGDPAYYTTAEFSATWVRTGLNVTGAIMIIMTVKGFKNKQ